MTSLIRAWKRGAHALGRFQTVLLLGLVYFLVLPPFSLVRLQDPLRRRLDEEGYWEPMEKVDRSMEAASRRF